MKVIALTLFSLCLIFSVVEDVSAADKLVSVVTMFRHGDRSIMTSYPKDPYKDEKYWPEGFNQLLRSGKVRQQKLGKWLRTRYADFLSKNYKKDEFHIFSADADVSLMSAEAALSGLYSPAGADQWSAGLAWEPVPVHTMPEREDAYVSITRPCPAYFKIYDVLKKSKYFTDLLKQNADMITFLNEQTGWKIDDIDYLRGIYSIFYIYSEHNSSYIPHWAAKLNVTKVSELAGIAWARDTWTPELKRWMSGPYLDQFFLHQEAIVKDRGGEQKFYMVSASSVAVTAILNTMGVFDNTPPAFSATIIWELYKTDSGSHYYKMYLRGYKDEMRELKPKGCGDGKCEFEVFKKLMSNYTVGIEQWTKECGVKTGDYEDKPLLRNMFGF